MAQLLACLHEGCDERFVSVAGKRPGLCGGCGRVARWQVVCSDWNSDDPIEGYRLSDFDRDLLKSLRITTS